MIKYARGGAVHYGRSFTRYFSVLGSILQKAPHCDIVEIIVNIYNRLQFYSDKREGRTQFKYINKIKSSGPRNDLE